MFRSMFLIAAVVFASLFPWLGPTGPGDPDAPAVAGAVQEPAGQPAPTPGEPGGKPEASLPPGTDPGWWAKVQKDIQQQEYAVSWSDQAPLPGSKGAWQAPNRAQGFRTYFTERGIHLLPRTEESPAWEWGLELARWGREGALQDVAPANPRAESNRVTLDRPGISEWYLNDERGLEQGFGIPAPPAPAPSAPVALSSSNPKSEIRNPKLFLDLALSGTLRPVISEDGQAVDFFSPAGNVSVLHYAQLKVTDATGRQLPARFEGVSPLLTPHFPLPTATSGGLRIAIDDTGAVYPITVDPLATTPAWTAEGNQDNAQFGSSVATAGDVNGDGYSDIIVGAPNYDGGQPGEGRAFVYFGSTTGLGSTPWTAESDQAGASFGNAVATAGDVNGDGYSDIIVGAPSYDNGQTDEGRAFVWFGSATGLGANGTPANADWTAESNQAGAAFGNCVATAGDVNGDGYSDVIVGASQYNSGSGRAYAYFGSLSGLGSTPWTYTGPAGSCFGITVATAGDVNGDGYADVIVGAHTYANGQTAEGGAWVFHGSGAGLPTTPNWAAESNLANAMFGYSVSTAGDVNGDGYSDVIVGSPYYTWGETSEGMAFLYQGSASGLIATTSWNAESNLSGALFGWSVATAGDVNGDGYSDVIVGARNYTWGETEEGVAFVYCGSASGLSATKAWDAQNNQVGAHLGCSVATAGDVNGDGYSDVIVGVNLYDNPQSNEGAAFVYLGSAAGLALTSGWTAESHQVSTLFGSSVSTAGDVDGNGYSDVVVGAPFYDNGQTDEGRAYLYLGSAVGLETTAAWTAESDQADAHFGTSVATAGDVNGDGYSDVIVGAPYYTGGDLSEGFAYLYYGSASGLGGTPWTAQSNQADARFGISVGTAGDVNGDGFSDVIVGANQCDNPTHDEGRAFVWLGSATGLGASGYPANADWAAESDRYDGAFGESVATAGDVNGDGYSDVIIGAPGYTNGETFEGRAYVYFGSALGLGSTPWTAEGNQAMAHFGNFGLSVGTAGDVNGDGYSDVIVGAPYYHIGQPDEGRAFVWLGSPAGLGDNGTPDNADWTAESDQADAWFGHSVGTAGDVNGDGYSDVIVGAALYDNGHTDEGRAFVYLGSATGLSPTSAWTAEGDQEGARLGGSVATAGDVNGDGYSDVIVGAEYYSNDHSDEGRASLFYGNGGACQSPVLQQRRSDDTAPISHLGRSDSANGFEVALMGRTPYGRGKFKVEWEAKPLGTLLDGTGTGRTTSWHDTGVTGLLLKDMVGGLSQGNVYHWRARLLYRPATTPFQQHGRWLTLPYNGPQEADLRSAFGSANLGVAQVDSPDPLLLGQSVTYTATINNAGPDWASAALTDRIWAYATFVSATPSQGSCSYSSGVVNCALGVLAAGESATVSIVVMPASPGSCTNRTDVYSHAADGSPGDNMNLESTTVLAPAIGNIVWADADGDGIQDAGENGIQDIPVGAYDGAGNVLASSITDAAGAYHLTGLTYGQTCYVRVFPPPGYSFSPQDQGGDDTLDSDVDVVTGQTPLFSLVDVRDPVRWDAGLRNTCIPPDEACWIYSVTRSVPDNYPTLNFQDPNQANQRTGWNIRRSSNPALPKNTWPIIGSNVTDMDLGTPNYQYTDITGGTGTWYYQVTAYNAYCPAEGPF